MIIFYHNISTFRYNDKVSFLLMYISFKAVRWIPKLFIIADIKMFIARN